VPKFVDNMNTVRTVSKQRLHYNIVFTCGGSSDGVWGRAHNLIFPS